VRLLEATESGLDEQFRELRPVLRTVVRHSAEVREAIRTLALFSQYFPESMPGDYLQLDVCQALPEQYGEGTTCPQAEGVDDPGVRSFGGGSGSAPEMSDLERLLRKPLEGSSAGRLGGTHEGSAGHLGGTHAGSAGRLGGTHAGKGR
jgi:hypothetical protein